MLGHLGQPGQAYDDRMAKSSVDMKALAAVGAEQRLLELAEERKAILAAFPQLRAGQAASTSADGAGRRRKRRMSAAARRRISQAQKARWAKQKATAKKAK